MPALTKRSHWDDHARQWSRIASPLRPHADDEGNVRRALGNSGGLHLLLGVTPEYARMFDRVVAVDRSAAMIGALWQGDVSGKDAIQADWMHLPLRERSFDACIGDGCLNFFSCPSQYGLFFHQVQRVLRSGGRFALRIFIRPDAGETCAAVCEHAMRAGIGSFHAFKWRLAMAIAAESCDSNLGRAQRWGRSGIITRPRQFPESGESKSTTTQVRQFAPVDAHAERIFVARVSIAQPNVAGGESSPLRGASGQLRPRSRM